MSLCYKALGEDLRGVCTDYHAEPGLGLRCSVELSAWPNVVDESVLRQCVNLPCASYNSSSPLVNTAHIYQVHIHVPVDVPVHMYICSIQLSRLCNCI